jgi:hypothetical protein
MATLWNRSALMATCMGTLCLALSLRAAEPKAPDPDLPQPLDPGIAQQLLENPPFTRALNLSESLLLTGVAYVDGKPVATVKDRSTNKSYVVTDEPNAMGWRLAEATPSTQLKHAEVKIMVGSEIIPIRYNLSQTAVTGKGYMPSKIPTPEEFTGHDDKGAYVRGFAYLSDRDRDRFRGEIPKEVREKFLNIVHDHRDMLFKASHEDRAAFVKKAFDAVVGK